MQPLRQRSGRAGKRTIRPGSVAKAAWVQYPNEYFNPYTNMPAALHDPLQFDTLEEIDHWFLAKLGENFDAPGSGIFVPSFSVSSNSNGPRYTATTATISIKSLFDAGTIDVPQAEAMELVLNDWRMSFLGASPQYSEAFRPKDFSGDGQVHCSAYVGGSAPAAGGGNGPKVADDRYFSLTGCFYIGKSRFFRIFSRGELWDNFISSKIADETLDTVICIDPDGSDPRRVETLYQRALYNKTTTLLPRRID